MPTEVIIRTCGLTRQTTDLSEKIRVLSAYIGDESVPKRIRSRFHPYSKSSLQGYTEGLLPQVKGLSFWEDLLKKAKEEQCSVLQLNIGTLKALHKEVKRGEPEWRFWGFDEPRVVSYLEVKISDSQVHKLQSRYWCPWSALDGLGCFHEGREPLFEELQKEITDKNLEGVLFVTE